MLVPESSTRPWGTSLAIRQPRSSRTVFADLQGFFPIDHWQRPARRADPRIRAPRLRRRSSARIRAGAAGSANRMVPSETTLAPTATSSSASSPEHTPPIPTIGTSTACAHAADAREGDRPERRTGVAAGAAAERRLQRGGVERQAADRVDEREPVRPGRDDGPRRLADVPRRGRELGVERLRRARPAGGDDLGRALGRLLDVRAREVELDHLDVRPLVEPLADPGIVADREAADRDPDAQSLSAASAGRVCVEQAVDARAPGARSS